MRFVSMGVFFYWQALVLKKGMYAYSLVGSLGVHDVPIREVKSLNFVKALVKDSNDSNNSRIWKPLGW